MKENLINCYHELLKIERKKLKENGDVFNDVSKLEKDEIERVCKKFNVSFSALQKERLLVQYPDGKFRTLHYDIIFRLINIRAFEMGSRIPLEYKIYQHSEFLPDFKEKEVIKSSLPEEIKKMLIECGKETLSNFQLEYIVNILREEKKAYVISSPTATGKSLIFTVPMIRAALNRNRTILIYPRKALASDQLLELLEYLVNINENLKEEKRYPITIGIDDGDTPKDEEDEIIEQNKEFRGVICPFCRKEGRDTKLFYHKENHTTMIKCQKGHVLDFILPTKEHIRRNPPLILITNNWTLNRRLIEPQARNLFSEPVKYIVLDESHIYREELGAHIHFVIKRLKKILRKNTNSEPIFIISSATLPKNTLLDFASKLLNINKDEIFWRDYEELVSKGKEKLVIHLVLLPNPFRSAEVLAENVLLFLIELSYFLGKKSIFFVDSIHEIHRLRHFVEVIIRRRIKNVTRALEHLNHAYNVDEPFYWGHYSQTPVSEKDLHLIDAFSEAVDYHYGGLDKIKRFQIEEMFKKGIKKCLLATSTLELGINIGDLSFIAHYRYPLSGESYIQRTGRAGRSEESYYTTLSILILTNSPAQLKYVYGEETPSIFELPSEFVIPLPLENESIKENHQFLEVLDNLARLNRPTFVETSDILNFWRGKKCNEVLLEVEKLIKEGIKVQPSAELILKLYLERLQHRKHLMELVGDEELPLPLKFKEKLDKLKEIEEWCRKKLEEIEIISNFPENVKEFFYNLIRQTSLINNNIEHAYHFFKAGDRESFEKICREIENQSKNIRTFFLSKMEEIERTLHNFWSKLMEENAPEIQRRFLHKLVGEIFEVKTKIERNEISYRELLGFFLDIKLEIESLLAYNSKEYWKLNLIELFNLLRIPDYYLSLLFDKPLPKIYVNYPGLPSREEEYIERTIDKLLWICTPFRVTPIQEYFFTTIYGLDEKQYKIKDPYGRYIEYNAFEGGEPFTFNYFGEKYSAWTPNFINMINLNTNIIEAYSNSIDSSQNSKIILSNTKQGRPSHDLENCRFCRFGFLISSENRDICTRSKKDCALYHKCNGVKHLVKPEPLQRTSYLGLVKVYPQVYTNASKFESELINIPVNEIITVKFGKGSIFDKALIGCYLVSSGDFFYSPAFKLTKGTLGYRISSNGVLIDFQKEKVKVLLRELLKIPDIKAWVITKYLISEKYFKEKGDVDLENCQKAFEGLINDQEGTKAFKTELKRLLKKEEVNEEIINFAAFLMLHSLSHLFYEFIVDYLKTDPDNLAYHIDRDEYKIYLIENAQKGLGLTETLLASIRGREKEFFIDFFEWVLKVINDCEMHENEVKKFTANELLEKITRASEERQEKFNEISTFIKNANQIMQADYNINFPVEILRNILVKKFGNDPLIMEAIISNISYCWDGCYNCVRLERGCNYDPFKQITRVSKRLLSEVIKRMLEDMKIPICVGRGFDWILEEMGKARNVLRISSPWLSKDIIQSTIEPLLKKDVEVKIITRKDFNNEEQVESLKYLTTLAKSYKNMKVKQLDSLHAKMILVDDRIGIKGSMNLTLSGIHKNVELVEKYEDPLILRKLIHNFESLFNLANELVLN